MSEIEEWRKKRLEELQKQQQNQASEEQQVQQQIAELEQGVKPLFTKEALTRYGTLKTAYPDRAVQALIVIAQLAQCLSSIKRCL